MMKFQLTVTLESPLYIGCETQIDTDASRPLLKLHNGQPYIPATSIRGRLRHEIESILRQTLGPSRVCNPPQPDRMCHPLSPDEPVCAVCNLFGSPWRESRLRFGCLTLSEASQAVMGRALTRSPQTTTRAGIGINRQRRIVQEDLLFWTELFEPGFPWEFVGNGYFKGTLGDLVPLYLAAACVNSLGGSRTRGLGWCRLTISAEGDQMLRTREAWDAWLEEHR